MEKSIIIAGFGGQGIIITGTILANAFMLDNKNVICCPCYGAEMRGGEVNCTVVVNDNNEDCVDKAKADIVVALNQLSFDKFIKKLREGGTIIANSSLIQMGKPRADINYVFAKISDMAKELGDIRVTNIISLGLLSQIEKISVETLQKAVQKVFATKPASILNLNFEALKLGRQCAYEN